MNINEDPEIVVIIGQLICYGGKLVIPVLSNTSYSEQFFIEYTQKYIYRY